MRDGGRQSSRRDAGGRRRSRVGFRVNLLFVLPFPFLVSAFTSGPVGLALNLACFGLLMAAAWLTRDGLLAEDAYDARRIARRPAIPRKLFAAAATGAGLGAAGLADGSVVASLVYAALGTGLHVAAFGPDPLRHKSAPGAEGLQSDRVARAVDEAEAHLAAMRAAIAGLRDRQLEERVQSFQATAREMFRTVEQDPRDLTAARRYLGVYLLGARDATTKFAELQEKLPDPQAREDYLALLEDLQTTFAAKNRTLLIDDRPALDVEIGVLRDRLARENV